MGTLGTLEITRMLQIKPSLVSLYLFVPYANRWVESCDLVGCPSVQILWSGQPACIYLSECVFCMFFSLFICLFVFFKFSLLCFFLCSSWSPCEQRKELSQYFHIWFQQAWSAAPLLVELLSVSRATTAHKKSSGTQGGCSVHGQGVVYCGANCSVSLLFACSL